MFLEVQYDANLNHAHGLNADATENAAIIGLAIEGEPGVIDYGIVSIEDDGPSPTGNLDDYEPLPMDGGEGGDDDYLDPPGPPEPWPGLEAGDPLLSFTLLPGGNGREVSAAATSNRARARNLELEEGEDGRWMLSWDYTNPGDNNQDGWVGVTDLTQIGQNYMARLRNSWDDPLRQSPCLISTPTRLARSTPAILRRSVRTIRRKSSSMRSSCLTQSWRNTLQSARCAWRTWGPTPVRRYGSPTPSARSTLRGAGIAWLR